MSLINWFYLEGNNENVFWEMKVKTTENQKNISDVLFIYIYKIDLCKYLGCVKAL